MGHLKQLMIRMVMMVSLVLGVMVQIQLQETAVLVEKELLLMVGK